MRWLTQFVAALRFVLSDPPRERPDERLDIALALRQLWWR